ncbi:late competence development ComFB family protein [Paenibacillus sp. SYP-B3998]|uniref:Late competence development ComFB family protein n=1 Tax=Paenibacillus sp. SYP-B3998 TaxID=2678564 RepID=A0A6G3ZTQ0_9BACL|nr:late competence development ComFB family protein [Paenibacillus sp. SYP-B3998]NEW04969.1 late competence development ComFB family protein [Paenibacillus sp. SYP-B3998]
MGVVNAVEAIVSDLFDEFQKNYELKCVCEQCQEDILALVLNQIPPKYTSSQKGQLFVKSLYLNTQLQSDVMKELTSAVFIVEHNQNHSEDGSLA